jgi:hypothetical protein
MLLSFPGLLPGQPMPLQSSKLVILRRRAAGTLWLATWCAILYAFAAPWRKLGGLESEHLRYMEWWVLSAGVAVGFTTGRFARDWVLAGPLRTHAQSLRVAFYPPAAIAAVALMGLAASGQRGPVGVVATAFLAYWAGLDVAFGAVPLMEGRSYAFARPLEPEPEEDPDADLEREAWDRF